MRLSGCLVIAALWSVACFAAAAETPAAKTSTPPDNPVPQPESRAPAATEAAPASDEQCRLATRESGATPSCISTSDTDHDGVTDGPDECPDTTPGVAVDATGCARADGDGRTVPEQ